MSNNDSFIHVLGGPSPTSPLSIIALTESSFSFLGWVTAFGPRQELNGQIYLHAVDTTKGRAGRRSICRSIEMARRAFFFDDKFYSFTILFYIENGLWIVSIGRLSGT